MKVSTAFLFDRATQNLQNLQGRLSTTQAQMAATKQILSPSDSPDQAAAIQRLQGEIDRQESHVSTLKVAMRRYQAEEAAIASANDVLMRVKELALQASNGTYSQAQRDAIAVEIKALRGQLLSLGNTRDDSGNYLFSGTRVNTPAFAEDANGQVSYQGDQSRTSIPAGVERTVQFTRSGVDVFARVIRLDTSGNATSESFFGALDQMIAAVSSSDAAGMSRSIGDVDQMLDSVSLSLAKTGSDQQIVQQQVDVLEQTTLRLKTSLSEVQDLDYAAAVTKMNREMLAMEAAMSGFAKISGLTLFDYIR